MPSMTHGQDQPAITPPHARDYAAMAGVDVQEFTT